MMWVLTILAGAGFCGILALARCCAREERSRQEAEIREMLRQDRITENRAWYIRTRQSDAREDLIRVWAELDKEG